MNYTPEEIASHISFLEGLVKNSGQLSYLSEEQRIALMEAAGRLSRPGREEMRKRKKEMRQAKRRIAAESDRGARAATGIRVARESTEFIAPERLPGPGDDLKQREGELKSPRNCYICKEEYRKLHFFYDAMCPRCADFNYQKRFQTAPLEGQTALITGSRLKIGYQATLMMLRAGARVVATTRFPADSALRFSRERDFSQWGGRLHIYGLDLRHTPSVELFCKYIEQEYGRLDILINNAAQTVRRPAGFYAHLMANENKMFQDLPEGAQQALRSYEECRKKISPGIELRGRALAAEKIFPKGMLDADLQQVDLRKTNSWRLRLGEIQTSEMFEVQLVNIIAPFVLCNRLSPMMKRDNTGKKHIVNVSAMEGKFLRYKKDGRHPHTNIAKAALNMLTHSSAGDLAEYGIFMNAVDTGWVTDEDPAVLAALKKERHDFQPPLDIVDGAARVCDPFFHGILTGRHWYGKFLKDYYPVDW